MARKPGPKPKKEQVLQYEDHPFCRRLLLMRTLMNLSQAEMSELLGIAPTQYLRYEKGRFFPHPELLVKIADTLKVSLDWLMGRVPIDDVGNRLDSEFALTDNEIKLITRYREGAFRDFLGSRFFESD